MKTLFLAFYCCIGSFFAFAAPSDTITVKVKDELNKPIKGLKLFVHHYPAFYSDAHGIYFLKVKEELEMPFEVLTDSKDYDIVKFSYYKDHKELLVKTKRKAGSIGNAGNLVSTTENGLLKTKKKNQTVSSVHSNDLAAQKMTEPEHQQIKAVIADSNSYAQYKGDFEKLTHEIYLERERLVANNAHIKDEISQITQRLDKEKNLTEAERTLLKAYLKKLEYEFEQNGIAFRKAEEQTKVLIDRLKMMLLEKDSINAITANKLRIEQEKRVVAEKRNTRSFTIFSIITLFLLLLAVSFYSIARKMRKQRSSLLLANHELNEQKKLVEEQNKQLDIFAYRASHDIKGPLKSITALSSLAAISVEDKEALELFKLINKSSVKLDNLVTEMLLLAKDSKSELTIFPINTNSLVDEILRELKNIEGFNRMHITQTLTPNLDIRTDITLFHSVVQNLIENAIKYSDKKKEQSTLHISTQVLNDDTFEISFQDNGVGIEEQFHEKVFASFFRNSQDSNGTGLGLYIVKQNITKLGGTIHLKSKPGEGSTFTVHLPLR
ncbi:MAG: sensor histidine kinase [Cytophagaceae bacterium]|jgi:signal transduction histidine kinase|nr:sensor histidine kinase [Cytophagaceae bacterium]